MIERRHEDRMVAKSCGDKRIYKTKAIAKKRARAIQLQSGDRLKAYKCRFCPFYHLTSGRVGRVDS